MWPLKSGCFASCSPQNLESCNRFGAEAEGDNRAFCCRCVSIFAYRNQANIYTTKKVLMKTEHYTADVLQKHDLQHGKNHLQQNTWKRQPSKRLQTSIKNCSCLQYFIKKMCYKTPFTTDLRQGPTEHFVRDVYQNLCCKWVVLWHKNGTARNTKKQWNWHTSAAKSPFSTPFTTGNWRGQPSDNRARLSPKTSY